MALIYGNFYSSCLKMNSHFQAFLPFDKQCGNHNASHKKEYLILLHGMMDNCTAWIEKSCISRFAEEYGVLIFMPEGHRSFYTNMVSGGAYFNFITEEVPTVMEAMFGISLNRENTSIAGNSMGGYGALKSALSRPDLFGRCGALSPVIHPVKALSLIPEDYLIPGEETAVWGNQAVLPDESSLFHLAALLKHHAAPKLYITCGQNDFLISQNRSFRDCLNQLSIDFTYQEAPGEHGWTYWNDHLEPMFYHLYNNRKIL